MIQMIRLIARFENLFMICQFFKIGILGFHDLYAKIISIKTIKHFNDFNIMISNFNIMI